jgi:predicted GIY-YIG superfamily endonuclease
MGCHSGAPQSGELGIHHHRPSALLEKEIKKWRRDWKINLIERSNPEWVDLYPSIAS